MNTAIKNYMYIHRYMYMYTLCLYQCRLVDTSNMVSVMLD